MTLEYLEIMEDVKKTQELAEQTSAAPSTTRRKLQRSFKSNTRIYDDGSIEVDPQAQGEPSQKDVKKVGKSKRYVTNGKNPLTCVAPPSRTTPRGTTTRSCGRSPRISSAA